MGSNLALNMERNGFGIAGYDLSPEKTKAFVDGPAKGKRAIGVDSPEALMAALERPRRVLMMVPAGKPVDSAIAHLKPALQPGDILIDGGNSWFLDTERRSRRSRPRASTTSAPACPAARKARCGARPSCPADSARPTTRVAPIFRAISAKAPDGEPCVDYMGVLGAGHYVKMVHNGIEYGDMQLIAEVYDLLHRGLGLTASELHEVFADWNAGELKSFLIEITANIFTKVDPDTGRPVVDVILDEAAQKGTGKWTSQNALDVGAPIPDDQRRRREPDRLVAEGGARGREQGAARPVRQVHGRPPEADRRGARGALREQDHVLRAGAVAAAPGVGRIQVRPAARPPSRRCGARAASSGRRCSATSCRPSTATPAS